jgi:hypothetical protein
MTGVVVSTRLMQLTTHLPKRRPARPDRPRPVERVASPKPSAPNRDARRGGGPEDRALYSCMCGFVFTAAVTTSVDCPHCGTQQAW